MWIDPAAYYDPPGGLLRFEIDQPASLVRPAGGMSVKGHIDLVSHQLRQLRAGLALATALKRVLVLPAVICGYDKYWGPLDKAPASPHAFHPPMRSSHPCTHMSVAPFAPPSLPSSHQGVIPGTHHWALPIYNCPLDHYLEVGSSSSSSGSK